MTTGTLHRFSAFTDTPQGGNPAGVWIGKSLPTPEAMQRIAAEVGFSETAFVAPEDGLNRDVRYYSPEAEVSFCGHATIASGVVLGGVSGSGHYMFSTAVGDVAVDVDHREQRIFATLTSVATKQQSLTDQQLDDALSLLNWPREALDPDLPPVKAYAGAWHLVIAVREKARLDALNYEFDKLKALMLAQDLTTAQLIWRESNSVIHSRNPFPVGGVVEDPATGAAAAALGGYLRDAGFVETPSDIVIHQGVQMGRPSRIEVHIPASGGIRVSGTAVNLNGADS